MLPKQIPIGCRSIGHIFYGLVCTNVASWFRRDRDYLFLISTDSCIRPFNLLMNGVVVCYATGQFLASPQSRLQGSTSWEASHAWKKMWERCGSWSLLLRASLIRLKQRSLMFLCNSAFQDGWWANGIAQPLDGPPRLLTSFIDWIFPNRSPQWVIG